MTTETRDCPRCGGVMEYQEAWGVWECAECTAEIPNDDELTNPIVDQDGFDEGGELASDSDRYDTEDTEEDEHRELVLAIGPDRIARMI